MPASSSVRETPVPMKPGVLTRLLAALRQPDDHGAAEAGFTGPSFTDLVPDLVTEPARRPN